MASIGGITVSRKMGERIVARYSGGHGIGGFTVCIPLSLKLISLF